MKKLLFNPFEKYNDRLILFIGLTGTLIGSLIAHAFDTRFDNTLHISPVGNTTLTEPLTDNIFNIACMFFSLYLFGYFINKKIRPIDILNTAIIARFPFYLVSFSNINGFMYKTSLQMIEQGPQALNDNPTDMLIMVGVAFLILPILVWSIALLYNGFKTAVNLKTVTHKILFALSLIVSLIISTILFGLIY